MNENEYVNNYIEIENIDLRNFLKEGNKIRTKFINGSEWINNTLTYVRYDTFEMYFKVSYVMNNLSKGDAMVFKYLYEAFEYVIFGNVEEINLYENLITIGVNSTKKYENRRKDLRFDVSLCGYVVSDFLQKPTYSLIRNISKGGLSFSTKADLSIGSSFGLDVFLSKEKIISLVVKVLRKSPDAGNLTYDTQIVNISRNSVKQFIELIDILEKFDDDLFYKYITHLNKS